ncbi:MAG TPA: ROK family protein [Sphingomicrobium sp.]
MSGPGPIIVADIGGTNARFAMAERGGDGVIRLGEPVVYETGAYAGIERVWPSVREALGTNPGGLAIAAAGPERNGAISLTNAGWTLDRRSIGALAVTGRTLLINDVEAIGHAARWLPPEDFTPILGPEQRSGEPAVTAVAGIGTGFGLVVLIRHGGGYRVRATEGGHADFAPGTAFERQVAEHLLAGRDRVTIEHVLSGPAIVDLAHVIRGAPASIDDRTLWRMGLGETDPVASMAVSRFCEALGGTLANIALVLGAEAVVLAGGLGQRLAGRLAGSGFADRFRAKAPMEHVLDGVEVRAITHPEPGLFGAAAAFFAANAQSGA